MSKQFYKAVSNSEKPGKAVGWYVLASSISSAIKALCDIFTTWYDAKKQKEIEDHKLKNAKELEEKKTEEQNKRTKAREGLYRRKRKRIANGESISDPDLQSDQSPTAIVVPNVERSKPLGDLLTTQALFNRRCIHRPDAQWIVQGYVKPGQITMLTAGGGVGKSVLLAQIALAAAKGERPEFLPDTCCASIKQNVVYYRIEDFPGELEGKYGQGRVFDGADIRWVLPEDLKSRSLDGFLEHVKQLACQLEQDTVICIDPATKLDGYSHETCIKGLEDAQRFALERNVTLTPIVAAHLNEINDWKHLSSEDIKGGDKGIQQAGAVIALRVESTVGGECRFIQCLKEPKGCPNPFPDEVLVCKRIKTQLDKDNWYLHFKFVEIKPEAEARPDKPKAKAKTSTETKPADKPKKNGNQKIDDNQKDEIIKLLEQNVKSAEIAKRFKISMRTVQRIKSERA